MVGLTRHTQLCLGAIALWATVALFGFAVVWSGAGMASEAASPLAAMSVHRGSRSTSNYAASNSGSTPTANAPAADADLTPRNVNSQVREPSPAELEAMRAAARTAAWWAVIGLLAGIGATVAGAWITAPNAVYVRTRTTDSGQPILA